MTTAKSASRKQTEASPQMEAFRLLFENHPVSMWVYDLETLGFLAVNEAAQEKYGYSRDEFLGMTLKDIRPLEDVPRLQADVERARPALQHSGLWRHRLKDGTLIDVEITSHTIEYEGRKAALVLAQNVTERTQAERALQVSDDRYRAFVQNSSEAIWCLELDSPLSATLPLEQQVDWLYTHASVVDCNDAMAVMHAYASREEMLGLQLSRLLPRLSPDNLKLIRDFIGNGYQINERESVELSHDVELRYFVSSLAGIVEESALRRIWGVKRDVTEHKRAEATLRESEEQFRATFEQAAVGIAHVAPDGRWLKVNQRLCEIVGYTRAELLTKTFQGITHPDDLNTDLEYSRQMLANEIEKYSMEKRYLREDGSIVWINLTVALVRASTGEPKYFISVVEDITERKRVEQQLSESEKRFSTVFFTNPVSQSVLSQNTGLVVEVNDACCSLYGYSRAELLGADPGQLDLWVDPAAQLPILDELQRTGHLLPTEVKIRRKSGEIHTVLFAVEPLNWTGIPCLLTSSIDITGRKRAEEALRLSETRYRRLHEGMRDCFVQTKMSGEIVDVNPAYLAMLGYSAEEVFKLRYEDLTPERWHTFELELVETQILPLGHSNVYEKEYIKKDGTVFPVELRTILLRDAEGKPSGMWAIVRDITERKRAEEKLLENNRRLELLNRIGIALAETAELSSAYHTAHTYVSQLVDCPCFGISLYDASTRTLRADYMLSDGELLDAARFPPLLFDESQSLAGRARAIFTQRPELMNNLPSIPSKETVIVSAPSDDRVPRSALYLPVVVSGQTIGLLELQSYRENAYGEEETSLLVPVANQIGLAIENARLFTDLEGERNLLAQRVAERTAELRQLVNTMAGREVRMAELKDVIRQLRAQLEQSGLTPSANDPLAGL